MSHQSHRFTINSPYQAYCFNRWHNGQNMAMHQHDCLQIYHVIEGTFQVNTGDDWQIIPPGHAHILPPGYKHALRTGQTDQHFSITFRSVPDERGMIQRLITAFANPCIEPVALPASLLEYFTSGNLMIDDLSQLQLIHLFDAYCLNLLAQNEQGETEIRKQKLITFLETNYAENLSVQQITKAMEMSRTSLQRFCSTVFHCGVRALHEQIRMEHAARLLIRSEISVSQCALECGYADIYAFSRSFKRIKGRSPQDFRHHAKHTDA